MLLSLYNKGYVFPQSSCQLMFVSDTELSVSVGSGPRPVVCVIGTESVPVRMFLL